MILFKHVAVMVILAFALLGGAVGAKIATTQNKAIQAPAQVLGKAKPAKPGKPAQSAPTDGKTLRFADEFNGTALDASKWGTCYKWINEWYDCTNSGNDEMEWYKPQNVTVANGLLNLTAKKEVTQVDQWTFPYSSGMVSSQDNYSFKYGYFEARVKVPTGRGLWSTFWTLPTDSTWPPEIDALEILGNDPTIAHMTVHYYDQNGNFAYDMQDFKSTDFSKDFHTYGVDWQPGHIKWYIDGVLRRTYTNTANIPQKPMFLIANLAVGGKYPGPPDANTVFPSTMQVDWIRVYQ